MVSTDAGAQPDPTARTADVPSSDLAASGEPRTRSKRPGGRSARVQEQVLTATLALLTEREIDTISVADIAARANVAETTVYRRWGSRTGVVSEAVMKLAVANNPPPRTGSLAEDLMTLAKQVAMLIGRPEVRRLLRAVYALSGDPEIDEARTAFYAARFEIARHIIEQAQQRNEIGTDIDSDDVIESLVAPMYFRILVSGREVTEEFVERCVRDTLLLFAGK
ncbi:TetR/AcrR family transcriptional regulator [Rhodococcus sovatensis]|uniref:TetR/AcrR family transcriptional regulator n=1 Tax=Rhodococcus sovatensis TaxID=1805840 RepID=A0ABZ2PEW8_9NOCA